MDPIVIKRLVNFFWIISCILFMVSLGFVYAFLPPKVGVLTNEQGVPEIFLSSDQFFYFALILFLVVNLLLYVLYILIEKTPPKKNSFLNASFRPYITSWLISFAMILNIFFILSMLFLSVYNNSTDLNVNKYTFLVYLGPSLIAIWLLLLLFLFLKKQVTGNTTGF